MSRDGCGRPFDESRRRQDWTRRGRGTKGSCGSWTRYWYDSRILDVLASRADETYLAALTRCVVNTDRGYSAGNRSRNVRTWSYGPIR
jgi:hypothetical protein